VVVINSGVDGCATGCRNAGFLTCGVNHVSINRQGWPEKVMLIGTRVCDSTHPYFRGPNLSQNCAYYMQDFTVTV